MRVFVRTVDRLGLGLGNLLRHYPLIGFYKIRGDSCYHFDGLATGSRKC